MISLNDNVISTWYEAYSHITDLLDEFYLIHESNTPAKLYSILKRSEFESLNRGTLFNSQLNLAEPGLDPIQIFATFNYSRIVPETRLQNIGFLLKALESERKIDPNIDFTGIPAPIIAKIINYRGWSIQNDIWNAFSKIKNFGIKGLSEDNFKSLKNWRGVDIPSFTMFLFWMDSENFLPLDVNTVNYLKTIEILKERPRTYIKYYNLCFEKDKLQKIISENEIKDLFRNIVKEAYGFYENRSHQLLLSGTTETFIEKVTGKKEEKIVLEERLKKERKEQFKNFKIIAVRPKIKENRSDENDKQKHLKNLKEGQIYQFYDAYKFSDDDTEIIFDPNKELDIYNSDDLNISISAVVGMNGSGKSTIGDFLYLVTNRISKEKKIGNSSSLKKEEVFADLYFKSDQLYKISVGKKVEAFVYKFDEIDSKYVRITNSSDGLKSFNNFDIEAFCYTIAVNYSLYGLNSNVVGNWITPLFHKNDSYQIPIVLNPKRRKGIIDVNIEDDLAKSRLLSNLLEPSLINFETGYVPPIAGLIPALLELKLDKEKLKRKRKKYHKIIDNNKTEAFIEELNIIIRNDIEFLTEAKLYIYLKAAVIPYIYSKFDDFKNLSEWINSDKTKLSNYVQELLNDTSHITFKFRQAVNYLVYSIYHTKNENNIIALSNEILNVQIKSSTKIAQRTIDLIPPAFLKTNIIFKHKGNFDALSSGEKQQTYSINTIAYHLFNLKSVMVYEGIYKYNSINIIFDEVELYFHPDLQRTYINSLRDRILTLNLNKENDINNINIIFITHSPFILSDIPKSNILMLKRDEITNTSLPYVNQDDTFAANVHELLANEFFMSSGFVGEFSKEIIQELIRFYKNENKLFTKASAEKLISIIGDKLISERLTDMHNEHFKITQRALADNDYEEWLKSEIERIKIQGND